MAKLIIANWKLNPRVIKEAILLAEASDFNHAVIAPPFIFLNEIRQVIKKAVLGAQDVFWENSSTGGGAYTGEISAVQLKFLGVKYVIVGHSERRRHLKETDEMINKKVKTALKEGLKVVLCVGEPFSVRKKGINAAKKFVKDQLEKNLEGIKSLVINYKQSLIIAYEPLWAIGAGRSDKPQNIVEMAKFIKELLAISHKFQVKVLYGGSVTSKNAAAFLREKEIDGVLVGEASLNPKEFSQIVAESNF